MPLFSSLCSSRQQIWTDLRKLHVKFSPFFKLDKFVAQFGHTRETCNKYLLQYKISCVTPWHSMCSRGNSNSGSRWEYIECYHCFLWCKLNLIIGSQHLLKVKTFHHCFPKWKLRLINGNQDWQHLRKYKTETPKTR